MSREKCFPIERMGEANGAPTVDLAIIATNQGDVVVFDGRAPARTDPKGEAQ